MQLLHTSELMWFLLFHQEEGNRDTGEAITAQFENSSCDEAEILHKETEHLSLGEAASSEEDESEYEDCQEEEEQQSMPLGLIFLAAP